MSRYSKKGKFALLIIAAIAGLCGYIASCSYNYSQMTSWQLEQKIDPDAGTGATKLKAHIDSATIAGLVFCSTAIGAILYVKLFSKK